MLLKLLQNYILPYEALKVDIVMYSLLTKLLNVCNMQVLSHKILMIAAFLLFFIGNLFTLFIVCYSNLFGTTPPVVAGIVA